MSFGVLPVMSADRAPRANITVSADLANKVRQVAAERGIPITDLIAHWLECDSGERSAFVSTGTEAGKDGPTILAKIAELPQLRMTPAAATSLANEMDRLATEGGRAEELFDLDADIVMSRKGKGVKLTGFLPTNNPRRRKEVTISVSTSVAQRIASAIREEVAEATGTAH